MSVPNELHYLTIGEAAPLIASGELSPVELTRAYLDRIDAVDGQLDSFVTRTTDLALSQARQAEAEIRAGRYRGPLHGIPIALKDLYDTAGIRTTAMSRVIPDRVPDQDATTVAKLYEAGAVLLGKLAMHEFALGGPDFTSLFPPARNPWNTAHMPGGSSSGSGAGGRRRTLHGRAGFRHRRQHPRPSLHVRYRRHQAHLRQGQQLRRRAALLVAGSLRTHDLDRRGLRHHAPGHRRLRSQGSYDC